MPRESIDLSSLKFDAEGRAIIEDKALVNRLKAKIDDAAIKNIGCCSAPAALDVIKRAIDSPDLSSKLADMAIKNIGCCSAPAELGAEGLNQ